MYDFVGPNSEDIDRTRPFMTGIEFCRTGRGCNVEIEGYVLEEWVNVEGLLLLCTRHESSSAEAVWRWRGSEGIDLIVPFGVFWAEGESDVKSLEFIALEETGERVRLGALGA
jgi:hypothetical protein